MTYTGKWAIKSNQTKPNQLKSIMHIISIGNYARNLNMAMLAEVPVV